MIYKKIFKRSFFWIFNAILFYLLKLNIFRDKNLWVYGCWEGNRYDDNSKYLFEHIIKTHPEIRSVWLSPNPQIVNLVRQKGYEAYCSNSLKGIRLQLRAGVCFFTNGLDDISNIQFIHGAMVIGLWHGTGMKNVYYQRLIQTGSKFKYCLKRVRDKIFSVTYQDFAIATSAAAGEMRRQTYLLRPEQILITGQPRNDAFKQSFYPHQVLPQLKDSDSYSYILYMPTYRPYDNNVVEDLLINLNLDTAFIKMLEKKKIRFLLKLHYLVNIEDIPLKPPFIVLRDQNISHVQELLAMADYMITDYSGCCIDFAIQDKPILLYTPDYDFYCKKQSIKEEWHEIYKEYSTETFEDLKKKITDMIIVEDKDLRLSEKINSIYEAPELKNSNYSENVYQKVISLL